LDFDTVQNNENTAYLLTNVSKCDTIRMENNISS